LQNCKGFLLQILIEMLGFISIGLLGFISSFAAKLLILLCFLLCFELLEHYIYIPVVPRVSLNVALRIFRYSNEIFAR